MQTIEQFMWGFQPHFRMSLETRAVRSFETIDFDARPRAYLIGFATGRDVTFPVCFESEQDPLARVDFSGVEELADQLFHENPESRLIHSYRPLHERRQAALWDWARASAVRETLERSPAGGDRYFFVGRSGIVDGKYAVHPILSFPRARWDSKPALRTTTKDRMVVQPSLQRALVSELLTMATDALQRQQPPEGFPFIVVDELDNDEVARRAARALVQGVAVLAGQDMPTTMYRALDAVASQPYEGRAGYGRVILAAADHREITMTMQFLEPIRLGGPRLMRKTLEMTGEGLYLICDGVHLLGLGSLRPPASAIPDASSDESREEAGDQTAPDESIFEFDVLGQGVWEMNHRGAPLLRVVNTRPSLPKPRLSQDEFTDIGERLFPEATADDLEALWLLAENASGAEHGTMLVVHRDADKEASRLVPQAQRIAPTRLADHTLRAVTSIDGAVLVDASARCHAVGVILDGHATGTGDSARGARYNSAVRYQQAVGDDCMVVIVSEDGMIDLIPRLRRRIRPAEVEGRLEELEAAVQGGPDYEAFFRAWDQLETLAFYFTEAQCARANAARTALEEDRSKPDPDRPAGLGYITHVSWTPFEPSPLMNSSYYLDESDSNTPKPA